MGALMFTGSAGARVPLSTPPTSVESAIRRAFPKDPARAVRIARCESRLNPTAVNPRSGASGLFQIHPMHRKLVAATGYRWEQMREVEPNLVIARKLGRNGWSPWNESQRCWGGK